MWPRRKNVLIIFKTIFYTLLLSAVGFILVSIGGMILHSVFSIETLKIILLTCCSLLLLLLFHGCKIYRIVKIIKSPKKEIVQEVILRIISVLFVVSFVYLSLASQYSRRISYNHSECENTKKEFNDEIFDIEICRAYIYDHDENQATRIRVFDQQGRLRAVRNFVFEQISFISAPVEYQKNRLAYFIGDTYHYLNMPPTTLDQLRMRIPLSDIGQFDQLWCM